MKADVLSYGVPCAEDFAKIFGNINTEGSNLDMGRTCSCPCSPCFFCTCTSCDHGIFTPPEPNPGQEQGLW